MANNIIKGRKGGDSKPRTPTEQPNDLQSAAKAKILIALGEGEFAGGLTGKNIYRDGTPLENADGSQNFSGVYWEFRPGTQAQTYIQGIPGTENEISVGTEVSSKTAWTHTFTNTQLSAVRVRLKWPSLMKQEDDGDVVGNTVEYAIDLQTDGGAWQTVLETAVTGKATSGYERSHRIDLPQAGSTWTLRLRKITPDANSVKVGDVMTLQSYTEVIDAKLRYPNTALLYIEFDASQLNGSIPQISCEPRGRVIRVPDNYNPETREYTGVWTGGFKWAWTDNPAWIYYDIVTADRFGLGNRLSSANISKWTLYQIAQYCDQLVPDGRGGDGMEPRYTCNVYVQERNDAYTVLRDFAAIFRGMTCWNGEQIVVQADMPRDVDFTYTRANIVGKPRYSSSSSQVRYTNALISWSDPDNAYADAMEPAFIPELVSRYSFNQLEMTAIGCTRQSEAHRKGLWGILTNNKDRVVEFDVGLDGRIPQPGYIIALADELLAGRVNGGRISAVNGRVITLDRDVDAKPGDRLQLNLPSGISQSRTIQAVNGRRQITVTTAYSETPERECVWAIESDDLFLQQYRVTGVKENSDATLTITGVAHDPDKFARIDTGAIIDQRPVSVLPTGNQSPPDDIVITSRSVVNQGISVETMQVNWSAVSGAIAYEAQWRRNDGNWINVPRSSTTSFEVSGIYAGRYLVRVRAINAVEISSGWAYSEEKTLTGKVGEPLAPLALATRSLVHGVQVSWEFPTGSGDTLRTELQYSKNQDGSAPMPLSDVAYPGKSYQQMGLSMGAEFWYRARLVDRLGNESPWTGWVQGMASDNFDDYYENLTDAIKDTAAWEETQRTINETQEGIRNTQQELEQTAEALRKEAEDQAKQVSQDIDASAKSITADVDGKISAVNKTITDEITSVNEALDSGLAQANKGVQEAKSAVADANKQIATVNKSLTDSITQVRQSVTDTAAEINATIDLEIARVSKTLADGDAALNAQIKTAENGLKQSLSQVNTTLTNAVKQETADRIADVNAKAAQAADELLAATQGIEASIESLSEAVTSGDENLARQISQIAAGTGEQFDSLEIWYFDKDAEGWTEDDNGYTPMSVTSDGWLKANNSTSTCRSPNGLTIDAHAYRFIKMRIKKVGNPTWNAKMFWIGADETGWNAGRSVVISEPEYDDKGIAILTLHDIEWRDSTTIRRFRFDFTMGQDADNYLLFDWIAVGRPAPGASTAALQDVRSTLSNALTAEAQARSTLAAQMRGSYDGSDLEKVTSGLLYQEKTARVTAISAEVKARESLQTQFNDNKAAVSGELSSLTTEQSAQASRIGGLETSLGKKADAAALTSLTQKVEQQGTTLTSQGAALTSLTNRVGQTETGLDGTNEALSGLQSVVTRQGDRITSQGQSITKLTSDLGTTNAALAKKAEAAAVTALTQQVEQNGQDIRSNTDSITSLSNQLVNGQPNRWSRRLYPVQLANAGTVPSFSDIRAVAPTVVDEVADAAKLDFTSAGSYLIALYSCQVKVAADTTITLAPGARVFDDTGAIFVNGMQVAWGNASWNTISFELKAGWNTVEFLVNQWTGQAYINLGLKLSDKVAEMYSGLGVSALANAAGVLSSNVSQIGNDVVSNSQNITQLRNALTQTDANVASKADQTAMNSLTGRVEKTESGLTAANANITSLKSAVRAGNASGGDLIPNPTFDPAYDQMGFSVVATTAEEVPPGCPYGYAARIASRDHHPNFAAFPATLNDVIEISALVACGAGTANFNLYVGTAVRPDTSTGAPLMAGGGKSPSATWQRTTWRFKVTQAMVGYIRPFLQISQNSPYGTVWFVTDWHMRNVTAAQKVQDTADATAAAVDSLTTTVTQQGNLLTSTGNRTTQLENGLATTNAAVAKKADATAVQDLTNTVTQLGNDLTAANSAITKLTGNLANTDKALAQKADATALATLDTKVTQQGKTLESQSNSLTNLSNSLSQVAADIDASGQIPGNLVVNPSFERGLDGYTGRSTATSVVEVSVPHSGTRALKVDPGNVTPGQYIPFVHGRTYEIGVWVKEPGATTDNGAGNNKLRIGNSAGQPVFERPYNSGTVGTNWTLVSGRWKATETASLPVTLSNYLISGSRYFDDFYVTDVTDRVDIDATAGAVTGLTSRVSTAEGAITSQSQQLTNLQNSLNTTNSNVSKKADATALTSVDNRVTEAEGKLTTQSQQLTNLANVLTATRNAGDNLIPNFDFLQGSTAWDIQYPAGVTFGDFGDGKAGVRLNRTTTTSPGIFSNNNKPVPLNGQRKYRVVVKAKGVSGAMSLLIRRQNKIGQTDSTYEDKTVTLTTDWQTITWETGLTAAGADGQNFKLYSHPTNGEIWLDSVRVFDITDETNIKATSDAVSSLTGTVTNQGNTLTSQGQSITALNNALEGVKGDVAKKADASAVSSLTNRVTQTEKDIRSQADSLTRLNTSLKQQATRGANVLPDGSFESYAVGDVLSNARAVITSEAAHSGTKSLRVTRSTEYNPNATDNNDTHIFSGMQVRDNAVYYVEAWVKLPAGSTADPTVYMVLGFSFQDSANGWSWPGLNVKVSELSVDNWTKVSGYLTNNRTALKQAMVRISIPNTPKVRLGDAFLIDDLIITDVTDAKAALDAADANAQALSSLSASVTQNGKNITSQGSAITKLQSDVTQLGKDISGKADASALTNLTTRVTATEGSLKSQGDSLTSLQNSLNTTNSNVAKKADATALQSLQNTVEQQGKDLTAQSNALTNLQNSLSITNGNVAKKADSAAVSMLSDRVSASEGMLTSQGNLLTMLKGSLSSGSLIGNGGMESDLSLWVDSGTGSGFTYNDAEKALQTTTASIRTANITKVPVEAGTVLTLSLEVRSSVTMTNVSTDTVGVIADLSDPVNWLSSTTKWLSGVTTDWQTKTFTLNIPATFIGNYVYLRLAAGTLTPSTARLLIRNVTLFSSNGVSQKASAQSVSDLTNRVTSAEGKITSQGQAITKLQGDLSSTTDKVNTKADQTALNALTGRVEKTEAGLTAANSNIVSLTAAVTAGKAAGDDYIPNPSLDPAYDRMGYDVVETTAAGVPADCPFTYAIRLAGRDHVPKINNIAVTPGDVFEMSALVACGAGSADFNFYIGRATTATDGIKARTSGGNTKTTTAWKRVTWRFTVPADTNFLRPFLQVNQSSPFGTVWYAADWHMRNVTAANSAQKTADATAKAVDSLTTTVSQQGDTLSSIGTRTTSLENSLRSTNDTVSKKADTTAVTQLQGTVTQQGNDIAAANSALTKLSSDLATTNANVNKKADASAMNTLQNQVTEQGKTLSAQGDSLTQLSNSLSQTAADIDASGKMPGNLIVNGSFERGAAGFTGWSSTATVADLQVPHSGNKALKMSAGQSNLVGQEISITQGRTYRMGVWAKQDPGTTIKDAGNTKFRVADSTGLLVGSNYGPFSSGWQLVTFDWKATKTTTASFQLTTFLSAGAMYFDDFHVLDVTDEKDIAANAGAISQMNTRVTAAEGAITTQAQQLTKLSGDLAVTNAAVSKKAEQSAVTGLTTRMTSAEGKLDSQSQQLTSLQNSLTTMNTELGKKADTSAVSSLTGRVSQVENTITSQSQSITSLTSTINTIRTQGANPWVDGTFESYSDGQVLGGNGTAVVVASQKFTGGKSLKLRRDENNSGNSDKQLGTWQSVREDAKFRFEFWAMMPADQAPSSGWTTLVGIQSQNAAGQNAWQAAVTVSEASLGARDKWVKFTGIASNNGAGRTRAVVWISTRGATGNGTPGYSLYIDDLVITDVTDAKAAQDASDATASAVSGLTARVTDAEGKITAQAQQQTALATKVDNANSRVDNMAKTLSDSQSTQASLNTSLQSQIDAQAAANIKNQTTLDNTIKSVASITSTQQTHATALEALATQQTTLTSSVGDLSASVQNTAKTVADVNGTVSSLWSMKVETVNGKNVGAGITLGSNGETSDMILYADRFSLFNRNNATAVPVMVAEGNELYIDTARIKNSSLTSAKIADGSITNAKIGNEIRSNNFVDGLQGWRIAKDGSSQFNNVIVRGRVEANSGVFRGTVQADSFIGDIAVAKSYDSLTFRRNQTVQRNGAYQNRGYSMTVVLACTLVCQTYGTGSGLGYTSDITFNIGGQEVTRRIFVDAGNITGGTTAFELRFAARLDADYNNVGFFIRASGRTAAIDYTCTVENITATAFRTDSSSFS
ncbi:TPA: carbohydrate binding domain-containing protein [Klebsiella pneumoniae]|nr:carbohydrate binding domain-containing protein [Klebsiella pneumoniae]HCF8563909.1 carbohydrate binding domain-containing protein [Klebsiella pneumoniae]HCF8974225.1 carbohydrate binding domain-containing protein [Klebsiella pneumoniae]